MIRALLRLLFASIAISALVEACHASTASVLVSWLGVAAIAALAAIGGGS